MTRHAALVAAEEIGPELLKGPGNLAELLARLAWPEGRASRSRLFRGLNLLRAQGLARRDPTGSWHPCQVNSQSEALPLDDLDVVLVLTVLRREVAYGFPRLEVSAEAVLGETWPEGTAPPPRYTSAVSESQVKAAGGLEGLRQAALAHQRRALTALRAAPAAPPAPAPVTPPASPPTPALAPPPAPLRPPPPPPPVDEPTPMVITPAFVRLFIEYCASVPAGPRAESAHSWLKGRGLTRLQAEQLLEELVTEGRLVRDERAAAGGTEVVRYRPADPTVQGAPLPRSDAPPAELAAAPARAPEEPQAAPVAPPPASSPAPALEAPAPAPLAPAQAPASAAPEAPAAPAPSPPAPPAPALAPPPRLEAPEASALSPLPARASAAASRLEAPPAPAVAPVAEEQASLAPAAPAPAPPPALAKPPSAAPTSAAPTSAAPAAPSDPRDLLLALPASVMVAFGEASRELLQVEAEEAAIKQARVALEARIQEERAALEARASAVLVARARVQERRRLLLAGVELAAPEASAPALLAPAAAPKPPPAPVAPTPALPALASTPAPASTAPTPAPAGQVFSDNPRLALGGRILLVMRPGEAVRAADLAKRIRGFEDRSISSELGRQATLGFTERERLGVYRLTAKGTAERLRLGAVRAA